MAKLSQKFREGFVNHYTSEEKVKTGIRVAAGIIPLIAYSVISDRDIRYFMTCKLYQASYIRMASIITAVVFLCWLALNTIFDQITDKVRNDKQKTTHRITTLAIFALVVIIIKLVAGFIAFPSNGFSFIIFLPELIEIVLFGLMLYLCNMKRG